MNFKVFGELQFKKFRLAVQTLLAMIRFSLDNVRILEHKRGSVKIWGKID